MNASEDSSKPDTSAGLSFSVRLSLLIAVAVLEIGFIWFIRHFGWMESVNIGTQALVVSTAALPLLLAGLLIFRRRFKLSSMLGVLALLAIFLGFAFRPVADARAARLPTKVLMEAEIEFKKKAYYWQIKNDRWQYRESRLEVAKTADWILRLMGDDAKLVTADQIQQVTIKTDIQLAPFGKIVQQLPNLQHVSFNIHTSVNEFADRRSLLKELRMKDVSILNWSNWGQTVSDADLSWLQECRSLRTLSVCDFQGAVEQISGFDNFTVEFLTFHLGPARTVELDWDAVCRRPVMQNVKHLQLSGYVLSQDSAQSLVQLKNLRSIQLYDTGLANFDFLNDLPKLEMIEIDFATLSDQGLTGMKFNPSWKQITLHVPTTVSLKAIESLRDLAPQAEYLSVNRAGQWIRLGKHTD